MLKTYLNPAQFWSGTISSKSSSLLETSKRFCSASSALAFYREFKQDARRASELSGYFFLVDRKWIFLSPPVF